MKLLTFHIEIRMMSVLIVIAYSPCPLRFELQSPCSVFVDCCSATLRSLVH